MLSYHVFFNINFMHERNSFGRMTLIKQVCKHVYLLVMYEKYFDLHGHPSHFLYKFPVGRG